MKCLRNCMVKLALLVCCFSHANTATKEELATVFLRSYTGYHVEEHVDTYLEEAETLILNLDPNKPTVVYIHGFTESTNSTSVLTVVNAYLQRADHNVLAVDWSVIAGANYIRVTANVESVGISIAMALNDIVHVGLPSENIHVVGHSMGAHVSAFVGRNVDFSLPRITGLDPAGPLFNFLGRRLTHTDAKFVDIIHTDSGFFGIARSSGTVDFFPNRGRRIQPGCPTQFSPYSVEDFCSHHRSWIFYAESLRMGKHFLAIECSNLSRERRSSYRIIMGYATPTNADPFYIFLDANYGGSNAVVHESNNLVLRHPRKHQRLRERDHALLTINYSFNDL